MTETHGLNRPRARIDCAAIANNARTMHSLSPGSQLLCVVKANAYGHGIEQVARQLSSVTDGFAVARMHEAIELREHGVSQPIVIMSPHLPCRDGKNNHWIRQCTEYQLVPVLHEEENFDQQFNHCQREQIECWIKVDTGMHRLGLSPEFAKHRLPDLDSSHVLMTHHSDADSPDDEKYSQQANQLLELLQLNPDVGLSIDNSASLYKNDIFSALSPARSRWIRPGIALYGLDPFCGTGSAASLDKRPGKLEPAMTFEAPVISLRTIPARATVGYGGSWLSKKPSTIATIAAGYADGYPRHAGNGTPVSFDGEVAPLVGRVSMDMITVDVTQLVDEGQSIEVGDIATLWGSSPLATEVANHASTISYQLVTGIGNRVERLYV